MIRKSLLRLRNSSQVVRVLKQYLEQLSWVYHPGHSLGFNIPDQQYFALTSNKIEIPQFLLDQQFLHHVSNEKTLPLAKNYLKQFQESARMGQIIEYFSFQSQHVGAPEDIWAFGRLLIYVPGYHEKWVQFALPHPGRQIKNVSVISVFPSDKAKDKSKTYFQEYYRQYHADGEISLSPRIATDRQLEYCVSCHKSGVLPISPRSGSILNVEKKAWERLNERIARYHNVSFGPFFEHKKLGPGLGSLSPHMHALRTEGFFK